MLSIQHYILKVFSHSKSMKISKLMTLPLFVVAALSVSCGKLGEQISDLEQRIAQLEDSKVLSVEKQITSINGTISDMQQTDAALKDYISALQQKDTELSAKIQKTNEDILVLQETLRAEMAADKAELSAGTATAKAEVVAQMDAYKVLMEGELTAIGKTIDSLKAQDSTLLVKIEELKAYVDSEISSTKDWANATFATIEQQNDLSKTVAGIKTQLESLNTYTLNLNVRLTNKTEELSQTISALDASTKEQIETLTGTLTESISSLKTELTDAYTSLIAQEITALETSLKSWVNEQLSAYYTAEQVEAKLSALSEELGNRLDSDKAYLEGLIASLETSTNKKIAANTALITLLRNDLTAAQEDIAENAGEIADDAILISQNTQKISENATAISKNTTDIAAAKKLAADNSAFISSNSSKISEMEALLETLKNSGVTDYAEAIVQNTKDIATNAAKISENASAISSNTTLIADMNSQITTLNNQLTTTKAEITEAYTAAIKKAIDDYDGTITPKLASDISAVETKITELQTSLTSLTTRVTKLEDRVDKVEEILENLTSISYIPIYSDYSERVEYVRDVLDFSGSVTLRFDVHPASSAEAIAKDWSKLLSARAVYTATKSSAGELTALEVTGASAANGILSVTVSTNNLGKDFIVGTLDASVVVKVSSENRQIISDYVHLTPVGEELEFVRYLLNNFDSDGDGKVNLSEMQTATELNVSGMNIQTLDGVLEQMPKLTSIDCSANNLKSLNVSKNTLLTKLDCSGNEISELDLSQNTLMENLDCSDNKLSSLYVTQLTKLLSLNVSHNSLTALDISNNTLLTDLDVSYNDTLSTLDVSHNSSLVTLNYSDGVTVTSGFTIGRYIKVNGVDGIAFYVSEATAKIVSIDESSKRFECYNIITGATSVDDGASNTDKIVSDSPAAQWCRAKGPEWYLPAKNELKLIYNNTSTLNTTLESLGGTKFSYGKYWTSTEIDAYSAYYISFNGGNVYSDAKSSSNGIFLVRAVRVL